MIGEVNEEGGEFFFSGTVAQVFAEVDMRPKVMVRSRETEERFLNKLGGSVLGYCMGW